MRHQKGVARAAEACDEQHGREARWLRRPQATQAEQEAVRRVHVLLFGGQRRALGIADSELRGQQQKHDCATQAAPPTSRLLESSPPAGG